jgi:anti-sigma factor RsiW
MSTEQLSSYMDGEIGLSQAERIEEHLGSCPACRGELEAMERLVLKLHRIERPALPLALAAGVRRQIARAPEPSGLQRLWLLFSEMSLRPAFRTSAAMGLAINRPNVG